MSTSLGKVLILVIAGLALLILIQLRQVGVDGGKGGQIGAPSAMCPKGSSPEDYVREFLPSIPPEPGFKILEVEASTIEALRAEGGLKSIPSTGIPALSLFSLSAYPSLRAPSFTVLVNNSPDSPLEQGAYRGRIFAPGGGLLPNSLVALYIQPDRDLDGDGQDEAGFVSGYFVAGTDDINTNWYFIEPLRPLLIPVLTEMMKSKKAKAVDIAGKWNALDRCVPSRTHIIYKAGPPTQTQMSNFISQHNGNCRSVAPLQPQQPPQLAVDKRSGFCIDLDPVRHKKSVAVSLSTRPATPCVAPGIIPVEVTVANWTDPLVELNRIRVQLSIRDESGQEVFNDVRSVNDLPANSGASQKATFAPRLREGRFTLEAIVLMTLREGDTKTSSMSRFLLVTSGACPNRKNGTIPVVLSSDESYYDLYTKTIKEKAWWEGQEEVLNLVDAFYINQIGDSGFQGFKVRSLETWTPEIALEPEKAFAPETALLDRSFEINAYSLLCHFAQDIPATSTAGALPAVSHTHVDEPMITHLFSGAELGGFENPLAMPDSGCCWCESSCSGVGSKIIGMAEGIGGLRNHPSDSCTLEKLQANIGDDFIPAANHGLSKHKPVLISPDADPEEPNVYYHATLYQRFLLLAHELGHNLGANHALDPAEINTVMYPSLQNTTRFQLPENTITEIEDCWVRSCTGEINP